MANIEMNFRQAKLQADKLDQLASQLDHLASGQFGETMQNLSASWKGESANAYLQKGRRLESNMKKTADNLRNTARQIRTVAKKIYDAEMRAKQLAEKRTYGSSGGGGRSW